MSNIAEEKLRWFIGANSIINRGNHQQHMQNVFSFFFDDYSLWTGTASSHVQWIDSRYILGN